MMDRKDPAAGSRERSLLSIGDALRAATAPAPSRLQQALSEARASRFAGRERDDGSAARARAVPETDEGGLPETIESSLSRTTDDAGADPAPIAVIRDFPSSREPATGTDEERRPEAAEAAVAPPDPAAAPERAIAPQPDGRWEPLIDPAAVARGIWRSKRIIAACTIAGAVLGVLVALNTPRTYEAVAELLADPRDLNLVDRELTQSGISNEATLAIVDNQVRILKSGVVLANVVRRLNLDADPEFNGTAGSGGIGSFVSGLRSLISRGDGADDPGRRHALAVIHLAESLSVTRGGRTFVVMVGATTNDPEKSALIANTTAEVFLQQYGLIQSGTAGRAAAELTGKLDELRAAVETAERRVEAFKAENDLIDAQGRLITDDEILRLNEQLAVARARTLELNARAASARAIDADDVVGGVLPEEISSATIQDLRSQYAATRGEIDRLSVRLGPRHPQLQAFQAQLSGLRDQIEAEIRRLVASTQTDLRRAVQLEQELSSRLAQLKVRQGDVSAELVTLRELERDASSKRAVYEQYLLRSRETGEQQGINSANISVITPATAPLVPNSPSRAMTAIAGTVLGFLAGVMIGGLRGAWDGFRGNPRASAAASGIPLLRRRRATMFDESAPSIVPLDGDGPGAGGSIPAAQPSPQPEAQTPSENIAAVEPERPAPMNRPYPAEPSFGPYAPAMPHPYASGPVAPAPANPAFAQAPHPGWPQAPAPAQPWPAHPAHAWWWNQGVPGYPGPYAPQPWPQPQPQSQPVQAEPQPPRKPAEPDRESLSAIEEIRESLRECREAIRELADQRSRRRYF